MILNKKQQKAGGEKALLPALEMTANPTPHSRKH